MGQEASGFTAENAEIAEKRENQISAIILDAALQSIQHWDRGCWRARTKLASLTNLMPEV